jgi:hypothetical protein
MQEVQVSKSEKLKYAFGGSLKGIIRTGKVGKQYCKNKRKETNAKHYYA